jgi:pyruvate kinase
MLDLEEQTSELLRDIAREHRLSAKNFLHYLAMQSSDLGELESRLAMLGMASLSQSGPNALDALNRLLELADRMTSRRYKHSAPTAPCDSGTAAKLLDQHQRAVCDDGTIQIVTMPSAAAHDYSVIHGFLKRGMGCMRIDCARDDRQAWRAMVQNLDKARVALKRGCIVLMDLAGVNITTGAIEPGPAVLKVRPSRDEYGRVAKLARLWIGEESAAAPTDAPAVCVDKKWLSGIAKGDDIRCLDTRGRRRRMEVLEVKRGGVWVGLDRTAYLTNDTILKRSGGPKDSTVKTVARCIAAQPGRIALSPGDTLTLSSDSAPGRAARKNALGHVLSAARIPCNPARVLTQIKVGDRVSLDGGRVGAVVEASSGDEVHLRIRATPAQGAWLTANASIRLPDTVIDLPTMTPREIDNLKFIVKHADLVGLSSIHHESEVRTLIDALRELTDAPPGLLLTLATRQSYARLPAVVLAAMRHPRFGVSIVRSELAQVLRDERLSDAEHEITALCEAAHCPLATLDHAQSTLVWQRAHARPPGPSKLARGFEPPRKLPRQPAPSRESMLEPIASEH